jgi:hypothetical protein
MFTSKVSLDELNWWSDEEEVISLQYSDQVSSVLGRNEAITLK